jgi:DNA adenine methylase
MVLLSGYHSPLYDDLYADWHHVEVLVQRPSGNRRGHSMPPSIELLWSNREIHSQASLPFELGEEAVA